MKTSTKKFTAFILAITLTLPFVVFAAAQDEKATGDGPDIAYEMPEMRNEYEKHFLMSDGTAVAATYADPVNYYDISDNTWKEVDNTLTLKNGRYQNKGHGGFDVSFRGENDTGDLVKITVDEHTLSWNVSVQNVLGAKDTLKTQVSATVSRNQDAQNNKFAAKNAGASIKYNSPFSGNKLIDVNYTVSQYKVKEDITIYSPKDGNAIYYTYNCGELTAVLNKDNSIDFIDEAGNPIYTVHSPYMYDSAGNGSHSFRITLKQTDDICTVVMTPDKEWLNSADRVYPVVIDPTVTNNKAVSNYSDTYIHSGDTAGEHANETKMYFGKLNGVQHYSLIRFGALPEVPANSELLKAQFVFTLTPGSTTGGPFTAKLITTPWNEPTVCYNNRPQDGIVLDTNVPADFPNGTVTFDVTDYYIKTKNGTYPNYGIWIQNTNSSLNDYNVVYTSNCGDTAKFPSLIVTYRIESETESNNTFLTANQLEVMPQAGVITTVNGINKPSGATTDYDYYKFVAPRHGRIVVTLTVLGTDIYNVIAYNDKLKPLTPSTETLYVNPDEYLSREGSISFTTTKDGDKSGSLDTYYIRVHGPTNSSLSYRLTIKYTTAYAALNWQYPLPMVNKYITSPVGYRTFDKDYHQGVDIDVSDKILKSATDGKVLRSEYHESAGYHVCIYTNIIDPYDSSKHLVIVYMHLSDLEEDIMVAENDTVQKGQDIGVSGDTGEVSGPHLHFEVYSTSLTFEECKRYIKSPYLEWLINPYEIYYNDVTFYGDPY